MRLAYDNNEREEPATITVRIPAKLRRLVRKYVMQDTHLNESDFIRDAIREKIQRDAPELHRQLFQTEQKEVRRDHHDE